MVAAMKHTSPTIPPTTNSSTTPAIQGRVVAPFPSSSSSTISFASSSEVEKVQEAAVLECSEPESRTKNDKSQDVDEFGTQTNMHTEVGVSIEEPKLGMVFASEKDLVLYYTSYGKQCGFSIITQRSKRNKDGKLRYVTLGCARGGKARNRTSNVSRPRPTSKTGCKARINATLIDGLFKVLTVDNTHNHGLSPEMSIFFSCNREISKSLKSILDTNNQVDSRMNKNFASIMQGAGGLERLPFLEKDCHNYIDKTRQLRLGKGGAEALCGYFERMQCKNDGFFVSMDFGDDSLLRNIFWTDARSRAAYKYFGDVIIFDTTYLLNRFDIPFAPFVGVNHHGQRIILGAGLISSEDTETFTWLFETWLKCMDGKAPKAIITDKDKSIKNAIAHVFPTARHRYCLWHILRKLRDKLGSHSAYKTGLKSQLLKCIYESETIEDFEKCWDILTMTYNLQENPWLQSLYSERKFWAPLFLKDTFWAGMSTTQRSKSMNAFFDGYVHSKTNLKEFVDHFDNALRKKIENETVADFHSFNATIPLVSTFHLENVFQDLYTNSKFKEVQQQVMGMLGCLPVLEENDGLVARYRVEDEVRVDDFIKEFTHVVYFKLAEQEARCSCGLFETRGILCRHQLTIFKMNRVRSLPNKYILDRWRKDIKRTYTLIPSTYDVIEGKSEVSRYARILKVCSEVAINAASCDAHAQDFIDKLYALNEVYCATKLTQQTISIVDTNTSSSKVVSPLANRGKDRLPTLRRVSRIEKLCKQIIRKAIKKGKTKQPRGGDTQPVNTCKNLFIQTPECAPIQLHGNITEMLASSAIQFGKPVLGTQDSMQLEIDGTQLDNRDGTKLDNDMEHNQVSGGTYE